MSQEWQLITHERAPQIINHGKKNYIILRPYELSSKRDALLSVPGSSPSQRSILSLTKEFASLDHLRLELQRTCQTTVDAFNVCHPIVIETGVYSITKPKGMAKKKCR